MGVRKSPGNYLCLLIAKTILITAIRALPCYAVTRHSPDIFIHTILANSKAAAALPAKTEYFSTAITFRFLFPPVPLPV